MTRIRKIKNWDLPPNLYKRNGYYSYRDPRTRKEYGLGRNKA
ncbi:MAG: phage integrase Arm DNA-binding domain-containing protein, partial [Arsenophonus endosymbiont of Dermacentor nuttalli]